MNAASDLFIMGYLDDIMIIENLARWTKRLKTYKDATETHRLP